MKKRVPFIRQLEETDCGAACLSMLLSYHGKKLPLAAVAEAVQVDQYGTSIYGLLDGGKQFGLTGTAMEGTMEELTADVRENRIQLPVIARIVNRFQFEHFVVITDIHKNKVHYCDPAEGHSVLPWNLFSQCFLGQIVCFEIAASFEKGNCRKGSMMEFVRLVTCQKGLVAAVGALSLFITAVSLLGTFLFQYLIDGVLPQMTVSPSGIRAFAIFTGAVGILYLFRFFAQLLRGRLLHFLSMRINLPLMLGYYDHIIDLKMDFFGNHKTGDIISRFGDAGKVQEALSGVLLTLMIDVPLVLFCGVTLYRQSIPLFLVVLVILALYLFISALFIHPLDQGNRELMLKNSQLTSYIKETIDGIQTVKAFDAGEVVKAHTKALFDQLQRYGMNLGILSVSKNALVELSASIGILALLWAGMLRIAAGDMTLGALMTFCTLLNYFLEPVQNVIELQSTLQSALVAAVRLRDILDRKTERNDHEEEYADFVNGDIVLNRVDFRYGNRSLVLNNLSLTIHQGNHIALVGPSGCGKTTITKLLMGFYQPEAGQIRIGNQPLSHISLSQLRKNIAYVPQETFLYADSIRNNLDFSNSCSSSEEQLEQVLTACGCSFIRELPFGLDTMLEENGCNLSGGQRQRLSIARALLRQPKILILDEATSNLDTISEYKLLEALKTLYPEMTVIMVAHRLISIRSCSHIFALDKGNVVESGSHEELVKNNGMYSALAAHSA